MKLIKSLLLLVSVLAGFGSAYSANMRATFVYANISNNGTYTLLTVYDPARCLLSALIPCAYASTTSLGATATKHQLTLAGAIPTAANKVYFQ